MILPNSICTHEDIPRGLFDYQFDRFPLILGWFYLAGRLRFIRAR